jgi:hypothetical protein
VDEPDWGEEDPLQLATLKKFLGDRSYVWLYRSSGDIGAHSVGEYSALLPSEAVERAVADPGWEVMIGDGAPGFCSGTNESGDWVTEYERYYQRDGAQLLVLSRSFDGVRPSHLELVEELRLLFNLWEDRRTGTSGIWDGTSRQRRRGTGGATTSHRRRAGGARRTSVGPSSVSSPIRSLSNCYSAGPIVQPVRRGRRDLDIRFFVSYTKMIDISLTACTSRSVTARASSTSKSATWRSSSSTT